MPAIRVLPSSSAQATSLLRTLRSIPTDCPCHSNGAFSSAPPPFLSSTTRSHGKQLMVPRSSHRNPPHNHSRSAHVSTRSTTASSENGSHSTDYAFEMAASAIRFGRGATAEVGMDAANLGVKRVVVVVDSNISKLPVLQTVLNALRDSGVESVIWDRTGIEPKDIHIREAIDFAKPARPDAFIAVGGGSVIDTAKLMNLYTSFPDAEFLDFVNAPIGKGLPITRPLKPLIAVPTTAGTGSETTGTAIFDLSSPVRSKTGIAHRALKPSLGICDPDNTATMPRAVAVSSGLDVLCHSLESWTAIPYTSRGPRPANPVLRPAYQGSNPISDVFSMQALRSTIEHLPRVAAISAGQLSPEDRWSQEQMLLSATLAGVGFGNAGVHLCHGMSYPISSQNPSRYTHPGYSTTSPIIPHGVSVAVTAPAVFRFTAASNPDRHLAAAACFSGVDISSAKRESAGEILAEALAKFLEDLGDQPLGLKSLGFGEEHLDELVEGTIPQKRVISLAPGIDTEDLSREREQLRGLFEAAM